MSEEPAVVALYVEGIVVWLVKLRKALGGARGAVLLRLREWLENLGTLGGSAASMMGSITSIPIPGNSGTVPGWAVNDRFSSGLGRGFPFATLIESRMGFRRKVAVGGGDTKPSFGTGGRAAKS
jgi:hypothetical protein